MLQIIRQCGRRLNDRNVVWVELSWSRCPFCSHWRRKWWVWSASSQMMINNKCLRKNTPVNISEYITVIIYHHLLRLCKTHRVDSVEICWGDGVRQSTNSKTFTAGLVFVHNLIWSDSYSGGGKIKPSPKFSHSTWASYVTK